MRGHSRIPFVRVSHGDTEAAVILRAKKKYGMVLADDGSDRYFTGDSDDRRAAVMDGILDVMGDVTGGDFEAFYTGPTLTE